MTAGKNTSRRIVFLISMISAFVLKGVPAGAWGKTGHEIVAQLAMQFMNADTRQQVLHVLGNIAPEDAGVWMDNKRSDPDYDFMKTWHYINIGKGQPYVPTTDDNAVNHMLIAISELKHKKTLCADQIRTDVLVLFHLTGDLHQPLHAGYATDRGGNDIKVQFRSQPTNLHRVWDDQIIQQEHISLEDCRHLFSTLKPSEIKGIQAVDVVAWMEESRSCLDSVYSFRNDTIGIAYCTKNKELVEKRLLYAGLRLAAIMELVFPPATLPATDKEQAEIAQMLTPEEASNHINESVTVHGKVFGGKYLAGSGGTPTFINMGAAYPNSPLTLVIFGDVRSRFSYKPEDYLDGRTIIVTGKIKSYKGKTEIIISKESQILVQ